MRWWRAVYFTFEMLVVTVVGAWVIGWALYALQSPWWAHFVAGGAWGLVVSVWIRWRVIRSQLRQVEKAVFPSHIWVDPDTVDPMDPHGDGSLRPGDPMFDNVMGPMMRGEYPRGVMVVGSSDGVYEVHVPPKGVVIRRPDSSDG